MSIFFLKSLLSLVLFAVSIAGMFTMFEVFGRGSMRYNVEKLKKLHKTTGYAYVVLFIVIASLCLIASSRLRSELVPRSALHSVLALAIIVLFCLKVLFVRTYRQFYGQAKVFGVLIGIMTFVMVGVSGGYYLIVTDFGRDARFDRGRPVSLHDIFGRKGEKGALAPFAVRADPESIRRGKGLFRAKCAVCHDPLSAHTVIGPGLKGVLKNPVLPVSGKPATPANVVYQLQHPFARMPSFAYLSEEETADILAFLKTL